MINVIFKSIHIENFLSVGKSPLIIDFNKGMNVITGFNKDENDIKNGVGKSLVLDALYFCIFGNTIRKLSKQSFIVNRKIGKNCLVHLDFDIISSNGNKEMYVIERRLAPQSIKVWKNGNEITRSSTAETNKFIRELIYADEEIFQSCILMRANNTVPFMAKKDTEKKNFIESIFNLGVFSNMAKALKEDMRTAKADFNIEKSSYDIHVKNIEQFNSQVNSLLEQKKKLEDKNKEETENIQAKIDEERDKHQQLTNNINSCTISEEEMRLNNTNINICNDNLKKLREMKNSLSVNIGIINRDMRSIENTSDVCPTCNQKYNDEYLSNIKNRYNELKAKLEDAQNKLALVNDKTIEVESSLKVYQDKNNEFNSKLLKIEMIKRDLNECNRMISIYTEQLNKKDETIDTSAISHFEKLIQETEEEIKLKEIAIDKLSQSIGLYNICENLLGEYGIRTFVVNKLLSLLNSRISYYLSAIRSSFEFKFNEYFEEEIKDSNGILCLYNNCSGAEMKKIDLAIAFAILDIYTIQKQVNYNIIVFDEILDSSVDDKSLSIILNFITNQLSHDKGVYIISHKNNVDIPSIKQTILLEKSNGFTTRIS